jgi:hypothetical protein
MHAIEYRGFQESFIPLLARRRATLSRQALPDDLMIDVPPPNNANDNDIENVNDDKDVVDDEKNESVVDKVEKSDDNGYEVLRDSTGDVLTIAVIGAGATGVQIASDIYDGIVIANVFLSNHSNSYTLKL